MSKPQWVAKKYMGDDQYSYAIIDKRYLPKGHRGVIYEYLPENKENQKNYTALIMNLLQKP